ncbi:MAG: MBL fold metallo-hydrolase [Candidatus Omnitrophica bacterium]|nr:MBL fold metallo-hydrolase [Candidatus Omnitrophota bacterium]
MSRLLIQQYEIGPLNNFLYLLGDTQTKEMAVVDPAWDAPFLCEEAKRLGYKITKVFLTHAHPDHVNGLNELLGIHQVPVYISEFEYPPLRPKVPGLIDVTSEDKLSVGGIAFDILHTPGHTPGCQCFLAQGQLISGDTIFIDGCGRCDLPGSAPKEMYHSLYDVLMKLPDETVIYPGHNYGATPTDTLGRQKQTNPYLQCRSLKEFLVERMGL